MFSLPQRGPCGLRTRHQQKGGECSNVCRAFQGSATATARTSCLSPVAAPAHFLPRPATVGRDSSRMANSAVGSEVLELPAELLGLRAPTFDELPTVTEIFSIPVDALPPTTQRVTCRGSFQGTMGICGQGLPCTLSADGKSWFVELDVHPGLHQFEFLADGEHVYLSRTDRTGFNDKQKKMVNFRVVLSPQKACVNQTPPPPQQPLKDAAKAQEERQAEFKGSFTRGTRHTRRVAAPGLKKVKQQLVSVDPVMLFAVRVPSGFKIEMQCMLLQTHMMKYDMVRSEWDGDSSVYFFALPTIQTHAGIVPIDVWFQASNEANGECFMVERPSTKEDKSWYWSVKEPGAYFVDGTLPKKARELKAFRFATASTATSFTDLLDLAAQPSKSFVEDYTTPLNNIVYAAQLSKSYVAVEAAPDVQHTRELVAV